MPLANALSAPVIVPVASPIVPAQKGIRAPRPAATGKVSGASGVRLAGESVGPSSQCERGQPAVVRTRAAPPPSSGLGEELAPGELMLGQG